MPVNNLHKGTSDTEYTPLRRSMRLRRPTESILMETQTPLISARASPILNEHIEGMLIEDSKSSDESTENVQSRGKEILSNTPNTEVSAQIVTHAAIDSKSGQCANVEPFGDVATEEDADEHFIESEDKSTGFKPSNINDKIDELLLNVDYTSDIESETEENSFIDTMAEEGEEDTPSEGSNDIVEVGEKINTESDLSSDESYDQNSFIDDEENYQLLSGEEYDLSFEDARQRKRIVLLSSGSDDSIVRIKKAEKRICKKRKKSRIVRFEDSSDDELMNPELQTDLKGKLEVNIMSEDDINQNGDKMDNAKESEEFTHTANPVTVNPHVKIESDDNEIDPQLIHDNNKDNVEPVPIHQADEDLNNKRMDIEMPGEITSTVTNQFDTAKDPLDKNIVEFESENNEIHPQFAHDNSNDNVEPVSIHQADEDLNNKSRNIETTCEITSTVTQYLDPAKYHLDKNFVEFESKENEIHRQLTLDNNKDNVGPIPIHHTDEDLGEKSMDIEMPCDITSSATSHLAPAKDPLDKNIVEFESENKEIHPQFAHDNNKDIVEPVPIHQTDEDLNSKSRDIETPCEITSAVTQYLDPAKYTLDKNIVEFESKENEIQPQLTLDNNKDNVGRVLIHHTDEDLSKKSKDIGVPYEMTSIVTSHVDATKNTLDKKIVSLVDNIQNVPKKESENSVNSSLNTISNNSNINDTLGKKIVILENVQLQNVLIENLIDTNAVCIEKEVTSERPIRFMLNLDCEDKALNNSNINNKLLVMSEDCENKPKEKETHIEDLPVIDYMQKLPGTLKKHKKRRNKKVAKNSLGTLSADEKKYKARRNKEKLSMNGKTSSYSGVCDDLIEEKSMSSRKRKHPENDLITNESFIRKRKNRKRRNQIHENSDGMKMNILDEAILSGKKNSCIFKTMLDEDWNRRFSATKPKKMGETSNKTTNEKYDPQIKYNRKLHAKNFRDVMLYDNTRVKRMETTQLLRRYTNVF